MAISDWLNWQNYRLQYLVIFGSLNLLKNIPVVNKMINYLGGSVIMTTLAWSLTKYFRTFYNREYIPSEKKAVLITGADKGLANDLAIKLNEHGYRVYATVANNETQTAESLVSNSRFENLMSVKKMDVTDEEGVNKLAKEITAELEANGEELWAIINGAEVKEFGHFDWSQFKMYEKVFDVNTLGTVRVVRAFLPLIRKSKGRVVNIESIAGRLTVPKLTAFCMTKHANLAFADALRRELFDSGIKVSTVELAFDREPAKQDVSGSSSSSKFRRSIREQWECTTESVKDFYGSDYFQQLKVEKVVELFKNNLDEAMDDLIDAVRGQDPAIRYTPYTSFKAKLLSNFAEVVPIEWLDLYYYSSEKNSPKPTPSGESKPERVKKE